MARASPGAWLHDGDGCALGVSRQRAGRRPGRRRPRRRLPAPRSVPGVRRGGGPGGRGVVARADAPPPRHAERADGVPDRRGDRVGPRTGCDGTVSQLHGVRPCPARRYWFAVPPARTLCSAAALRPVLPARAAAQLQREVLPGVAAPLRLHRTLDGGAARRPRVPPRRTAPHAAGALGPGGGSRGRMILAVLGAAAAIAPTPAVTIRPVLGGFDSPTSLASTPAEPNRLYVVEQPGRIRYLVRGRVAGTLLDIRSRVKSGGEQGLLSVAFSPAYKRNHRFYVDYTDRNGNTRVVEFRSRNGRGVVSTARQLLFVGHPYPNHNGGQLQFGPDGRLYVGMGDGGSAGDPGNRAQNLSIRLGKLRRLNVDRKGASWQVAGYGLRNPWRFSFDRATRDLYIGDVGQGDWEEVDVRTPAQQRALANYGWRVWEGRARYTSGQRVNPRGTLVFPIAAYSHSKGCSITGGYVYRGPAVRAARGRYYYGDFCEGTIWSLRAVRGKLQGLRQESFRVSNLSSFGEDAGGELYAVSLDGAIFKLAR